MRSTVNTTTPTATTSDDKKKRKVHRRSQVGMNSMDMGVEPELLVNEDHNRHGRRSSVSGETLAPSHRRVMSSSAAHIHEGSIVDPVRIHPCVESTPGSTMHSRRPSLNGTLVVSPDLHELLTAPHRSSSPHDRTAPPLFSKSASARSSPLTVDAKDRSMNRLTSPLAVKPLPRYTPVGHTVAGHARPPSLTGLTVPRGMAARALTPECTSPERDLHKSRVVFSEPNSECVSDNGDTSGDESTSESLPGSINGSRASSRVGSRVVSRATSRRNSGQLSAQQAMMVASFSSALPSASSPQNQGHRIPGTLRGGAALERIRSMRAAASAPTSPLGVATDDQRLAVPPMQTRPPQSRPAGHRQSAQAQVALSPQAKLLAQAASITRVTDSSDSQDPRGRRLPRVNTESPTVALSPPSGPSSTSPSSSPSPSMPSGPRSPSNVNPASAFAASPSNVRTNLTREFEQDSPPREMAVTLQSPHPKPVGRSAIAPVQTHLSEPSPLQAALSPVVESLAESSPGATPVIGSMALAAPRLDTLDPFILRSSGEMTVRLSATPIEAGAGVFGAEFVAASRPSSADPSPASSPSPSPPPSQPQPVAQTVSAYAAGASAARRWSIADDSAKVLSAAVVAAHARQRSLSQTRDARRLSETADAPTLSSVTRDLSPAGQSAALALRSPAPAVSNVAPAVDHGSGHTRTKSRFARNAPTPRTASVGGQSPLPAKLVIAVTPPVVNLRAATPPRHRQTAAASVAVASPQPQPQPASGRRAAGGHKSTLSSPDALGSDPSRSIPRPPPRSPADPAAALALRHVDAPSARRSPVINARRLAIQASESAGNAAAPAIPSPSSSAAVHALVASPTGSPAAAAAASSVSREAEAGSLPSESTAPMPHRGRLGRRDA